MIKVWKQKVIKATMMMMMMMMMIVLLTKVKNIMSDKQNKLRGP
jgi:hypothetical protein